MRLIKTFGGISEYKINNSKSVLMFLNKEEGHSPIIDTPFMTTEGFRYLGVKITPELSEIISTNYDPPVADVTEVLNRWSNLPISMMGLINLIKMSILPTFLCYFQTLPLPLSNKFYDKLTTNYLVNLFGIIEKLDSACCT